MMIKKQTLHKAFFFVVTCLVSTSMLPNKYKNAVQEIHDEILQQYMPLLVQQRELIKKFDRTWYETLIWIDYTQEAKRDAVRQDLQAKELIRNFNILNAQAIGIIFCKECLEGIQNPNAQDLGACLARWYESDDRKESLWVASSNEGSFKLKDHSFRIAFHKGNRQLEKRIDKIIEENSEEQK